MVLKEIVRRIHEHKPLGLAAQIAFYFLLAFNPLLLVGTAALAYLPLANQSERIVRGVLEIVPGEAGERVRKAVLDALAHPKASLYSASIILLVWTASSGTKAIMDAVVRVREVRETRRWAHVRALAIVATLGTVLLTTVGGALVGGASRLFRPALEPGLSTTILRSTEVVAGAFLIVIAVQLGYHLGVPREARPPFGRALPGAVVAVVGWLIAGKGLALVARHVRDLGAVHGSLGAFLALGIFFYLGGIALVLGAEVNAWRDSHATRGIRGASRAGRTVRPAPGPRPAS